MGKYKNLLVNVGIFGLSAVATKLMAFILMPLYTLYLSTEEYGIMDMATIMVTTLFPVLTLLISEGMLRFTLDDKSKAAFYITETMLVMLASCVLLAIILPVFDLPIFGGLGRYKIWFLLSYAALCFPSVMGTVARAMDQMKLIAYASILSALIMGVLAYALIAGMNLGLMGYFYSYIVGNGSAILVYLFAGKQYQFIDFTVWRNNASLRKQLWRYWLRIHCATRFRRRLVVSSLQAYWVFPLLVCMLQLQRFLICLMCFNRLFNRLGNFPRSKSLKALGSSISMV